MPIPEDQPAASTPALPNGGTSRSRENARRKQSLASVASSTASTSRSSTASTSATPISVTRSHVQEDHNYGEPGPSTLRHTRRIVTLSRHQRNPDELDLPANEVPVDPLRLPETVRPENISGRLRHRSAAGNASVNAISSSTSSRSNHVAEESEDEQDEEEAEGSSDPDDDKPLGRLMTATTESQPATRRRPTRGGRSHYSDDEADAGPSNASRSTRTQKRPLNYNEDSDDESVTNNRRRNTTATNASATPAAKRRRAAVRDNDDEDEPEPADDDVGDRSYNPGSRAASTNSAATSNGGRHLHTNNHYNMRNHSVDDHSNSEDENGENSEPQISVSSRGRVRKISNRVKGFFRE